MIGRALVCTIVASGLVLGTGGPASAVARADELAEAKVRGDVVTYPQRYPLKGARRSVAQGRQVGVASSSSSSCQMPEVRLSLPPGERAIEQRDVSVNTRTCRTVVERGIPPRSVVRSWRRDARAAKAGADQVSAGRKPSVRALGSGYAFHAYMIAYHERVANRSRVSRDLAGVEWNRNGRCIGAAHTYQRPAAGPSPGWRLVSYDLNSVFNRCNYVSALTYAHFRNPLFIGCSQIGVSTHYNRTRVNGYPNFPSRRPTGSARRQISANCYGVLRFVAGLYY